MSLNHVIAEAKKAWHGVKLNQPDWGDNSHSIGSRGAAQGSCCST